MGLGDTVAAALESVGVTHERVERWLGRECGCRERQEKLNALGNWAVRTLEISARGALGYLKAIMGDESG